LKSTPVLLKSTPVLLKSTDVLLKNADKFHDNAYGFALLYMRFRKNDEKKFYRYVLYFEKKDITLHSNLYCCLTNLILKIMGRNTQSQEITNTGIMVNGIKSHQETLAQRKIDNVFADELQRKVDACINLNVEQETLKAKLKAKTEEFDNAFADMQKQSAEARKVIKLDIPQSSWREFGIEDKR
jgi:hypothetical protein